MSLAALFGHFHALLNVAIIGFLYAARAAVRRGDRDVHKRRVLTALGIGIVFIVSYLAQMGLVGHRRFPGDDWVRQLYSIVLLTHTIVAVALVPLVIRTLQHALRGRFAEHRRLVRFTFPAWIYVSVTALFIYVMNVYVRPPA